MDHIIEALNLVDNCPFVVDMELSVPGMEFNQLSGLIRNHQSTPEAIAHIIDIPNASPIYFKTFKDRYAICKSFAQVSSALTVVPHLVVKSYNEVRSYYKRFISEGYEGIVWKSLDHQYQDRRSWDWMRLVPTQSIDVKVLKFYEGAGKMKGIAGGFYFEFNGHLCKCGTMKNITYSDRMSMLMFPNEYIGRTAIVEFKELQPSGMPRQPRFKGFRDDK